MKRCEIVAVAVAAALLLAAPALAQNKGPISPGNLEHISYKSYLDNKDKLGDIIVSGGFTASALIGTRVMDISGKEVGKIADLGLNADGQVEKLIVSVGGFLGIGASNVAVDMSSLRYGTNRTGIVSSMTEEELESLPGYTLTNRNWIRRDTQ